MLANLYYHFQIKQLNNKSKCFTWASFFKKRIFVIAENIFPESSFGFLTFKNQLFWIKKLQNGEFCKAKVFYLFLVMLFRLLGWVFFFLSFHFIILVEKYVIFPDLAHSHSHIAYLRLADLVRFLPPSPPSTWVIQNTNFITFIFSFFSRNSSKL